MYNFPREIRIAIKWHFKGLTTYGGRREHTKERVSFLSLFIDKIY